MASDKFGNNPVAPLYNATGRNPRDLDMGSVGKGLGSVGSSGAGGKDFGISNRPAQTQPLGQSMMSPFNMWGPNSMYQTAIGRERGRRRRDEGGDYADSEDTVYDASGRRVAVDAMERTKPNYTVNFADQIAGDDNSVGKKATVEEGGEIVGRDKAGNDMIKNNEFTQNATISDSEPAKPTKVPRTAEQKAATAAKREEKKAANPKYGTRNLNRPPKEASPIARRRSAPASPKPAPIKGSRINQTMSIGDIKKMAAPGM